MSRKTLRRLAAAWLCALALWLAVVLAGLAQTAWYARQGLYEDKTLGLEDLALTSIKPYENEDDPTGVWFVSTDGDPQMLWEGRAYLNRVVLKIEHEKPGNGVELYYRLEGQDAFSERQVVYASRTKEGWFCFDLRGKKVSGLRIDPDSVGGVLTRFDGVELDAPWPLWQRFVPGAGTALLLVVLPVLGAAAVAQLRQWQGREEP